MKVLWIVNIVMPEALSLLKGNSTHRISGGWLIGAAQELVKQQGVRLTIATVSKEVKELTRLEGEKIIYYLLPFGKGNSHINHEYEAMWREVNRIEQPDVIHLHGTEFTHGLAYLEECGSDRVCVSIQGLVSASLYYYYGLSRHEIRRSLTPYSLLVGGILKGYRSFIRRGEVEKEIIRRVHHILGRTSWDRERIWAINPNATYHFCGETLRPEFYTDLIWKYDDCIPHSIFVSQASYPIKGLHMLLKAMPLVLKHYPDAKIRVAGNDVACLDGGKGLIKLTNYGQIIRKIIKRLDLKDIITFTGSLDAEEMRNEYLKSNVFICSSSIENSPNSLGEAQILGVPVIASYVGGIPDMMEGDEEHLYRFEEIEMLAYKICQLFKKEGSIDTSCMRQAALLRHNPDTNTRDMMTVYKTISHE